MKTWIVSSLGCRNYSRVETIQGRKLFAEIQYVVQIIKYSEFMWVTCIFGRIPCFFTIFKSVAAVIIFVNNQSQLKAINNTCQTKVDCWFLMGSSTVDRQTVIPGNWAEFLPKSKLTIFLWKISELVNWWIVICLIGE
jgi:hypothetical protein